MVVVVVVGYLGGRRSRVDDDFDGCILVREKDFMFDEGSGD